METKILNFLKENKNTYISGEDICRRLKVSRTAVWKHIQHLKEIGYEIMAQPHLGYQIISIPDKMLPDEISDGLQTKFFGKKIISYNSTASTNDIAYNLAEQKAQEGTLVIAEEQLKGKGRLGRNWVSPQGKGIYATLILRPQLAPNEAGKITLMAAVGIAKAIRSYTGLDSLIKWPNDILVDNEKVCGILTEMSAEQDLVNFVILGMGVNINTEKHELPKGATSLKLKSKKEVNRLGFLKMMLQELEQEYLKIKNKNFAEIINQWRNLSLTLGKRICIKYKDDFLEGQALDIDEQGALIVRDDLGFLHNFLSGDVTLVR